MYLRNTCLFPAIALAALSLVACETQPVAKTSVDRVRKAPTVENAPYSNIVVVGIASTREGSRTVEVGITEALAKRKVEAHSFVRESDSTIASEEAVLGLVRETDADAVIVVSPKVVGAELSTRDEQTQLDARVRGAGGVLNFFRYDYTEEIKRGSYSDYTIDVVLVTDVYDVELSDRIYSVESSTAHGQTDYTLINAEARAIVERLRKDGLIR